MADEQWKGSGQSEGRIPSEKMGVWDLIKTGAIIMAIILIIKIGFDILSRLFGFLRRAWGKTWGIAKANAVIFVGIPLAIAVLATIFPESGEIFYDATDSFAKNLDDLGLALPQISASPQISELPAALAPASELRGCAITMKYSAFDSDDEQRCIDVCREREYTSYGIVKDGNSYDCYCCHGSGTPLK